MSILDRLNLLVRSNLNDRSSRGDRWRDTFHEMDDSIREAKRELARVRGGEKQLVNQIRGERKRVDQWEDRAMLALKHGDEDLAREAIVMKNRAMREMQVLRDQLDDTRAHMRDIEKALEALEMKLDGTRSRMRHDNNHRPSSERDWDAEMQRRLNRRDDRQDDRRDDRRESYHREDKREQHTETYRRDERDERRSSTYDHLRRSFSDDQDGWVDERFDTSDTFRNFDRMSRKISEMEADIDAVRELSDDELMDPRKVELNRIFDEMEQRKRTDDDLSDLKRRFSDD